MNSFNFLTLYGILIDPEFHKCVKILKELEEIHSKEIKIEINSLIEADYEHYLNIQIPEQWKNKHFSSHSKNFHSPLIFMNKDKYIGTLKDLLIYAKNEYFYTTENESKEQDDNDNYNIIYEKLANEALKNYRLASENDFVYLDFTIINPREKPIKLERIILELYKLKCPKTCNNFKQLCLCGKMVPASNIQLNYKGNIIHRVIPNGWIQAGDITNDSKGDGDGYSIYGKSFPDECFTTSHDRAGILSMANSGPHTNGSQFFITLAPLIWLNKKKVAFGKVVSGMSTIYTIGSLKTENERPIVDCMITECGIIED